MLTRSKVLLVLSLLVPALILVFGATKLIIIDNASPTDSAAVEIDDCEQLTTSATCNGMQGCEWEDKYTSCVDLSKNQCNKKKWMSLGRLFRIGE